jgi:hypothetical protein
VRVACWAVMRAVTLAPRCRRRRALGSGGVEEVAGEIEGVGLGRAGEVGEVVLEGFGFVEGFA